jgi:DNA-binding NarL/FixJ family response regulator
VSAVRVILADDHALVRAGLRALLERQGEVEIVGETGDGQEVVPLVAKLAPDVLLLDLAMPGLHGLEAAERLAQSHPGTRVLVVSTHTNEAFVTRALRAGAAGYLAKDAAPAELSRAVREVMAGRRYLGASVAHVAGTPAEHGHPLEQLTPRQREVLQLLAEGHNVKDIAWTLGVSIKTVETHRAHIMGRLDIRDLAGLVRWAIRMGLISPES